MKKLIITTAAIASFAMAAMSSYGQGQIGFSNAGFGVFDTNTDAKVFGSVGTWEYGLYLASAGTTLFSQFTLVDSVLSPNATSAASPFAGFINGGTVNSPGNVANTLDFAAGTPYAFYVAAWSAAAGSSYATALANSGSVVGFEDGISALGSITPTASPSPVAQLFGSSAGQITTFFVAPVPEPATLALGGLGAMSARQ